MRDQTKFSIQATTLDFTAAANIPDLSIDDITNIIKSIRDPSVEIIDPTATTGTNTKTLLTFCEEATIITHTSYNDACAELNTSNRNWENLECVDRALSGDENEMEMRRILLQLGRAERLRNKFCYKIGCEVKELSGAVGTLAKLADGLLRDQEEFGGEIKKGKEAVRYAFTCRAINGQWEAMRVVCARIEKLREGHGKLTKLTEEQHVVFKDVKEGKQVSGLTFRELTKVVTGIVEGEDISEQEFLDELESDGEEKSLKDLEEAGEISLTELELAIRELMPDSETGNTSDYSDIAGEDDGDEGLEGRKRLASS